MQSFRKKPVVIEAIRLTQETWEEIAWLPGVFVMTAGPAYEIAPVGTVLGAEIRTLEGKMWAEPGDWIIRGVRGELYPCKPDIFAATYEAVADDSSPNLTFYEVIAQPYPNCKVSAGSVEGHPVDTLYLRLEKDGVITTELLLRPDEMAAIAWCATGALWSTLVDDDRPTGHPAP